MRKEQVVFYKGYYLPLSYVALEVVGPLLEDMVTPEEGKFGQCFTFKRVREEPTRDVFRWDVDTSFNENHAGGTRGDGSEQFSMMPEFPKAKETT